MKNPLLAPVVRVAAALAVSAVLFQAGREVGRLERQAAGPQGGRADPGTEMVSATYRGAPEPKTVEPGSQAAGNPVGESGDIITPLNVRDPSALVMGPGGSVCPPSGSEPQAVPPVPAPSFRPRIGAPKKPVEIPEGRLLDLLKKQGKTESDVPKVY